MTYNNLVEIYSRSDSPNKTTDSSASSSKSETSIRLGKKEFGYQKHIVISGLPILRPTLLRPLLISKRV